jgi:hypothetical protein
MSPLGLVSLNGTQISALPDFTSYSSQIAKITPSSTYASNYVVTNAVITSCPTEAAFSASPTLPPVVNQQICDCMISSLGCIAKPELDSGTAASLYENICGPSTGKCPALHGDGSNGTYGAYSMCTGTERLSWALDVLYRDNALGCQNDENAAVQNSSSLSLECWNIINQAGESGTGTITSYPSSTSSTQNTPTVAPAAPYQERENLSHGAIAGITVASIVVFASLLLGSVWFFCMRRRGFSRQKSATVNDSQPDSRHSNSPDQPSGLRGGRTSIISDDSRDMSELPPFDGSYMGSWSRSEFQSSRSELPRHASVDEGDAAVSPMHSPLSEHSGLEIESSVIPPSPMGSVKELPAFRTQPEDKSLPGMKLLSPVIKVSPV